MTTSATKRLKKAARIILIGAPGVGKGTQTERLLARFPQLAAISSGDLLRENVRKKTALGLQAEALIQAGNLVPDTVMLDLISAELVTKGWLRPSEPTTTQSSSASPPTISSSSHSQYNRPPSIAPSASFILDGFPRTAVQAISLDRILPINFVVHLFTPPSVIISRITKRWVHAPSGRVYNTDFNPPKIAGKDDITGEPLTQRADDSIDTWKQRLRKFEDSSKALIEHYERQGSLWRVEGNSSDEISPKLFAEIERRFA
ncbi:adenylate kinase 2 [Talaromyces stipitatus ATCC 10500]|uniref:GTP:AMP phosphotransferase, mitochondrial n=1 Tax=Talaromyces stipitatus (strain ATCC 10500 / CBS 375.48 / QM 6759 / NRRL 1006) TaxID=441959 RepID=B8MH75_TALSN|nr:adenylate kinase 2 [Talaromyces stipitatus ATCC 10500]EED16889.1 adenylate kinase 2 [Talaromyces stipitatus ATCC 10500]